MNRKRFFVVLAVVTGVVAVCLALFQLLRSHSFRVETDTEWAIGVYSGSSPLHLTDSSGAANPVVTLDDIVDVSAGFVADPFLMRSGAKWYLFYEVYDSLAEKGVIGMSESDDGRIWQYKGIVLREPFHLSYPYVFSVDGIHYMIPESAEAGRVHLYRAAEFPLKWELAAVLLEGDFSDNSVIKHDGLWWLFSCTRSGTHDELRVFFSDSIAGPWHAHPQNPIVDGDPSRARPGGRLLAADDGIIRFTQNDARTYGKAVRAFLITELTTTSYREVALKPDPVLAATGRGWTRHGMHHIDAMEIAPGQWLAAVDGYKKNLTVRLEY